MQLAWQANAEILEEINSNLTFYFLKCWIEVGARNRSHVTVWVAEVMAVALWRSNKLNSHWIVGHASTMSHLMIKWNCVDNICYWYMYNAVDFLRRSRRPVVVNVARN